MGLLDSLLLTLGNAAQWLWHDGLGAVGSFAGRLSSLLNPVLAPMFRGLNVVANGVGGVVFAPIAWMPGWLSNTIISGVTGVLLLVIFKYTSNQKKIGRVKDGIKADLLALKLFKDSLSVTFRSQGRLFLGSLRLLTLSLVPLAVMIVPVSLELAQMAVWYQWRPLRPCETALITMKLAGDGNATLPAAKIVAIPGAEAVTGPVRLRSEREICWEIEAREPGRHVLEFSVDGASVTKELVVGDTMARLDPVRPGWTWTSLVLHPLEPPFRAGSPVTEITIGYPPREGWVAGADGWLIYFFVASLVFAFILKPFLNVKI